MSKYIGTFWKGSASYKQHTQYFIVYVRGCTIDGDTAMSAIHDDPKYSIVDYTIPEFTPTNSIYNWTPATQEEWSLSVMRGYYQPSDSGS